jgi:hypothetical protein
MNGEGQVDLCLDPARTHRGVLTFVKGHPNIVEDLLEVEKSEVYSAIGPRAGSYLKSGGMSKLYGLRFSRRF